MGRGIACLQKALDTSESVVAVTGAGISVSAGISGFDGMDFLTVMQMSSVKVLQRVPEHYYRMARKAFLDQMFYKGPTLSHYKLADWETSGRLKGIITTNIDCLHGLAGSTNVAEIQGSFGVNECLDCGKRYCDVRIWNQGHMPRCLNCDGLIAPYPVSNHLRLLEEDVVLARDILSNADLVMFVGTNGPYCGTYIDYLDPYARIVQINPKRTQFDEIADINLRATADEIMSSLH